MPHPPFTLDCQSIGRFTPELTLTDAGSNWYDLTVRFHLTEEVAVGDWQLCLRPTFEPDFYYTPHLTPTDKHVIDMHVFRSPVLMMGKGETVVCFIPVMDGVTMGDNRIYLDLDAQRNVMTMGLTTTEVAEHVLYHRTDKAVLPAGEHVFRARILIIEGAAAKNPFRPVLAWYWQQYGAAQSSRLPAADQLDPYVHHTYAWAFDRWKDVMWQEFDMNGHHVGAPQFIVVTQQSPNYNKPYSVREYLSVWNQAWFSSLRSAQGVFRFGQRTGNDDLVEKARLTKELALAFPQDDGLFDAVVFVPKHPFEVDGKTFYRSGSWDELTYGNSNRNPFTYALDKSPRHILDMSWTALLMMTWYEELEQDPRLIEYATRYADRLLRLQDEDGYFPAWLDRETGEICEQLRQSPECAVSVTFLLKLHALTGEQRFRDAALRCMNVLVDEVLPESRWEDFETYWSCSRYGGDMLGKKFPRNACYKQCSFSPFWMAQALYECYQLTGEQRYLDAGERCLDEMLMFQSSFQPDYIPITVVGGFGVMNCDAELNDARQSLFAEVIIQYGKLLNRPEYIQRGYAALRASFSMMYCPENPFAKKQWEATWPFLNEKDYGFMMENYGHDGKISGDDLGIGMFTIYDWGNGAAAEAVERIRTHHGLGT